MACSDFGGATCWERPASASLKPLRQQLARRKLSQSRNLGDLKKNRRKQQEVRDIPKKMGKVLKSLVNTHGNSPCVYWITLGMGDLLGLWSSHSCKSATYLVKPLEKVSMVAVPCPKEGVVSHIVLENFGKGVECLHGQTWELQPDQRPRHFADSQCPGARKRHARHLEAKRSLPRCTDPPRALAPTLRTESKWKAFLTTKEFESLVKIVSTQFHPISWYPTWPKAIQFPKFLPFTAASVSSVKWGVWIEQSDVFY